MVSILPRACFIIGIIGILTYFLIFILSLSCYYYAVNRYTKRIFMLLACFSVCELPWYFNFTINREFNGKIVYSFHMAASIFYFATFSFVCFAWGDVLRAKNFELFFQFERREKVRKMLILANILFICLTIGVIIYCIQSPNLQEFFRTKAHELFACFDVIKNIVMGVFIAHFGHDLRSRLLNYYKGIVGRNTPQMSRLAENTISLIRVNQKLIVLIIISIISFLLKCIALIMWRRYTSPSEYEPPHKIRHRWIFWWIVFEIFPVGLPAITFFFTMGWPSKLLSIYVISFPDTLKESAREHESNNEESDLEGDERYSDKKNNHSKSFENDPNFQSSSLSRKSSSNNGIQITSSHLSPLVKSLLIEHQSSRPSFGFGISNSNNVVNDNPYGYGDEDCFHVINRLSALSGDLIDVELERESFTTGNGSVSIKNEQYNENSYNSNNSRAISRDETKSTTSSTGIFQLRFPSFTSK